LKRKEIKKTKVGREEREKETGRVEKGKKRKKEKRDESLEKGRTRLDRNVKKK